MTWIQTFYIASHGITSFKVCQLADTYPILRLQWIKQIYIIVFFLQITKILIISSHEHISVIIFLLYQSMRKSTSRNSAGHTYYNLLPDTIIWYDILMNQYASYAVFNIPILTVNVSVNLSLFFQAHSQILIHRINYVILVNVLVRGVYLDYVDCTRLNYFHIQIQ